MNNVELKKKMLEKECNMNDVASYLNISRSALYKKTNGLSEFTRKEIKELIAYFNLTDAETISIFFNE